MVGLTHGNGGKDMGRVPPLMDGTSGASNVRRMPQGGRKAAHPAKAALAKQGDVHVLSPVKVKQPEVMVTPQPSDKVALALLEDGDPGQMLSDIRDALFGPTRKLQEARLEELVGILEQVDRDAQAAHQTFAGQINNLDMATRDLTLAQTTANQKSDAMAQHFDGQIGALHAKLDAFSEHISTQVRLVSETSKKLLDEQAEEFSAKLERQSDQLLKLLNDMSEQHKATVQALTTEFSERMRELHAITKTSDENLLAHVETRVSQVEAVAADEKRRNLKVMTEGLNSLSEQLSAL